jgi:hypothetical protein
MNPLVVSVKAHSDFTLELVFDNGQEGIFDMKPYLSVGVFKQLKNYALFRKVKPYYGSIVWASEQDLSNDTLYMDCKKIHRTQRKKNLQIAAEPAVHYKVKKGKA